MEKFLALPFPRLFMYGEQNRSLTYLPHLAANGIQLVEITRHVLERAGDVEQNRSRPAPGSHGPGAVAGSPIPSPTRH